MEILLSDPSVQHFTSFFPKENLLRVLLALLKYSINSLKGHRINLSELENLAEKQLQNSQENESLRAEITEIHNALHKLDKKVVHTMKDYRIPYKAHNSRHESSKENPRSRAVSDMGNGLTAPNRHHGEFMQKAQEIMEKPYENKQENNVNHTRSTSYLMTQPKPNITNYNTKNYNNTQKDVLKPCLKQTKNKNHTESYSESMNSYVGSAHNRTATCLKPILLVNPNETNKGPIDIVTDFLNNSVIFGKDLFYNR